MVQLKEGVGQPRREGAAQGKKVPVVLYGGRRLYLRSKEGEQDGSGTR